MATKKTNAEPVEEVKTEAAEEEAAKETGDDGAAEAVVTPDPWDEEVPVFVPRARKGEDQNAYVCVNDRRFSIPRNGTTQKMPRPIAEILEMSLAAEARAEDYAEHIPNKDPRQRV